MKTHKISYQLAFLSTVLLVAVLLVAVGSVFMIRPITDGTLFQQSIENNVDQLYEEGLHAFRYDTFGDEAFWTQAIRLNEAVAGEPFGGVGGGLSPEAALGLGFKVDSEALPQGVIDALIAGEVDLSDPGVTLTLIEEEAIVGVVGTVESGNLTSLGITCAFCHAIVDDSFAPGIGKRLDGWANRDLDVGAIIALAPNLSPIADILQVDVPTVETVLQSWGPGKFDASLLIDGKAFRPDGGPAAVLIPPAFGLAGVNLHTWTGWGSVTHWNGFVANLEMNGLGTFYDPRLNDAEKFPIAAKLGSGNVRNNPDLVTPKLAALQFYQLSIPAPKPPEDTFDAAMAASGEIIFNDKAQCATCHVPPLFTEPGYNMHTPEEMGIDAFQADRAPDGHYRTAPLKGLWTHEKGGFYHDGRFSNLAEVIAHYDNQFGLALSVEESNDLEQYLLSLGDADVSIGVTGRQPDVQVDHFELVQNFPNPFHKETTIKYNLSRPDDVLLEIYSIAGRLVSRISPGNQTAGEHSIVWDGVDASGAMVASGVYFYRLTVGEQSATRKFVLVR